jgi:hypothetical protein
MILENRRRCSQHHYNMKEDEGTQRLPGAAPTRLETDANTHARATATVNFMTALEIWGDENVGSRDGSGLAGSGKRWQHFIRNGRDSLSLIRHVTEMA